MYHQKVNILCVCALLSGVLVNETVVAQVGCSSETIVDFTTSSPVGMTKTSIANPSSGTKIFSFLKDTAG